MWLITFAFPVFQFTKKFCLICSWQSHAPYQLFHFRKACQKLGLIPLTEDAMGPVIPYSSNNICSSLDSHVKCWNPTKQQQHSRCITVIIKGSELAHVVFNIQPGKVHMGCHSTIKQKIIVEWIFHQEAWDEHHFHWCFHTSKTFQVATFADD